MLAARALERDEVESVWTIDRAEVIENVYYKVDGALELRPEHYDMRGWPSGEAAKYTPILLECFDRGGWFRGVFDGPALVAVAVLDSIPRGRDGHLLQLEFLHVSSSYRNQGLGRRLFEMTKAEALARGASGLYISSTPSENTVRFYLRLGCRLTEEPDPELFEREPEDIHLECAL
jgi:predicted N-acetyltransferase YhbS